MTEPATPVDNLTQPNPGPPPDELVLFEDRTVSDEAGTTYTPFSDGWAIGFRVDPPDGVRQWIYLNPSTDVRAEFSSSDVFVYHDEDEADSGPHFSGPICFIETYHNEEEA